MKIEITAQPQDHMTQIYELVEKLRKIHPSWDIKTYSSPKLSDRPNQSPLMTLRKENGGRVHWRGTEVAVTLEELISSVD